MRAVNTVRPCMNVHRVIRSVSGACVMWPELTQEGRSSSLNLPCVRPWYCAPVPSAVKQFLTQYAESESLLSAPGDVPAVALYLSQNLLFPIVVISLVDAMGGGGDPTGVTLPRVSNQTDLDSSELPLTPGSTFRTRGISCYCVDGRQCIGA